MKKLLLVIISLPLFVHAQDSGNYECTIGDLTRRIEIVYETGVTVPCEVHYVKDTEAPGNVQVLWRAMNEEGYCEAKTSEFVAKLESMGWDCGAAARAAPEPAEETFESDDTDDLAPAAEIELTETEVQN
jgi:hypothetical protein